MSAAYLVAARRTAVAPRNGAFKMVEAAELGEAPIRAVLADSGIALEAIDDVISATRCMAAAIPPDWPHCGRDCRTLFRP